MRHHDGESVGQRHLPTSPEALRQTMAPSRAPLVIAVAGLVPWSWRADVCAHAGMPWVLGPARSMPASHAGTATHATIAAHQMAGRLRGGLWPHAAVDPAALRATRDRRRRRRPRRRTRAERLTPVQYTHGQDHVPDRGTKIAYKPNRAGVAERWAAPAVPHRLALDRALRDADAPRLRDREWAMVPRAQPPDGHPLSWRQTVPGLGQIRRLGRLEERHDRARCPRVQACVASGRVVPGATASAGTR